MDTRRHIRNRSRGDILESLVALKDRYSYQGDQLSSRMIMVPEMCFGVKASRGQLSRDCVSISPLGTQLLGLSVWKAAEIVCCKTH